MRFFFRTLGTVFQKTLSKGLTELNIKLRMGQYSVLGNLWHLQV